MKFRVTAVLTFERSEYDRAVGLTRTLLDSFEYSSSGPEANDDLVGLEAVEGDDQDEEVDDDNP